MSPLALGSHMRASLGSDSELSVSFEWYSPVSGLLVGGLCVIQGGAHAAPFLDARQIAVALQPLAFVDR